MIEIEVRGIPAPKGSKKAVRRGERTFVVDDNSESKEAWHAAVARAAEEQIKLDIEHAFLGPFVGVALAVEVVFRLKRPAGHYKKGKRAKPGELAPSAPLFPQVKPDLDKLVRATMDPLEGLVYDGDSRICVTTARKVYAALGQPTGATIRVSNLDEALHVAMVAAVCEGATGVEAA